MKIGIDARFYSESGVGRYLRNLLVNLKKLDRINEYFIFLLPKDYREFVQSKNFKAISADYKWYGFAEQFNLPKLLYKYKLDLAHFPHFNVPIFYTGKFAVTIHDLIHQHHLMNRATTLDPLTFKIKQIGYRRVFKTAVSKSQKILVPSKSVEELLIKEWNIKKEKIVVTPEAVDSGILEVAKKITSTECEKILDKFKINNPFLFYVGNAHPHKNLESLIKSFLILQKKYPKLTLVLSGNDHFFWQRLKAENQHQNIVYTGFVTDKELVVLYKNAEMFVLPSFEEGFGIPILEAFANLCPVVSSNGGSLPEIGSDAAIYFNPYDISDIVDKIERILQSKKLRQDLIKKGATRVKQFSWERLAKQTLEVYLKCA